MSRRFALAWLSAFVPGVFLLAGCTPPAGSRAPVAVNPSNNSAPVRAEPPDTPLSEIGMSEDGWYQVWDQAAAVARETGKPLMIDFTGSDWCGWCIKLDEEVFSKPEFTKWASENVVLLKLDFPRRTSLPKSLADQNEELRAKYGVQGFPTILFVKPDGEKIADYGYDSGGPAAWTAKASKLIGG